MKEQSAKYRVPKQFFSWLILLALLVPGACTQHDQLICCGNPDDEMSANTRLNGTWKVIAYEDQANHTRIVKDDANSQGLDVVLTFEGDRISGKSTTNQVNGRFSYTGTRQVRIDEYGGTEISEPRWGRMFGEAVFKFKAFTI
ncbi:MAG: hypothetical protein ICV83_24590, partial [Cytophagales bacterium]|nr:hypothetical protein [Cytophagales bacterium]